MVRPLLTCALALVLSLPLSGCKPAPESQLMNESLRLTPEQIARDQHAADGGDAEAAKRLWHHFAGVELDMEKGEMWRRRYDKLSETTHTPR